MNPEENDRLLAEIASTAFKKKLQWVYTHHSWNLMFANEGTFVHAWITQRPHYCDRGHFQLNVEITLKDPVPELDAQDGFPRYYMDFETAKEECELFLRWRLLKIPNR